MPQSPASPGGDTYHYFDSGAPNGDGANFYTSLENSSGGIGGGNATVSTQTTPIIYSITPSTVYYPDSVTITGSDPSGNFGAAVNNIFINNQPAWYWNFGSSQTPSSITFSPWLFGASVGSGLRSSNPLNMATDVKVTTASGDSNTLPLSMAMPYITYSATPSSVAQGQNLTITWNLQNAPVGSSVSMELFNQVTGNNKSIDILSGLPAQGTTSWTVNVAPGVYQLLGGWVLPSGNYHYQVASAPYNSPVVVSFSVTAAAPGSPVIYSLSPSSANIGQTVTINGSDPSGNFGTAVTGIYMVSNSPTSQVTIVQRTASSVTFVVPSNLNVGGFLQPVLPGNYQVEVTNSSGISNASKLTVTQPCNALPGQGCL